MRFKKWFLLPILLLILGFSVYFAINPITKSILTKTGQSITGAKVELGSVKVSFIPLTVRIRDIQVANPNKPMKNLMQLDEAIFSLQLKPLFSKSVIIENMSMTNTQLDTDRTTSGALPAAVTANKVEQKPSKTGAFLKKQVADVDLSALNKSFNVKRIVHEESVFVNERVNALEKTIELDRRNLERNLTSADIPGRVENVGESVKSVTAFSVESADDLKKLPNKLKELNRTLADIETLRKDINRQRKRAKEVKDTLLKERQELGTVESDYARLVTRLPIDKTRIGNVTEAVLSERLMQRLEWILAGIDLVKKKLNQPVTSPETKNKTRTLPLLWIKSIALNGVTPKTLAVSGKISHLSTHQALSKLPMVASLSFRQSNGNTINSDMLFDFRNESPKTQFLFKFDKFKLNNITLADGRTPVIVKKGNLRGQLVVGTIAKEVDGYFLVLGNNFKTNTVKRRQMDLNSLLIQGLSKIKQAKLEGTLSGTVTAPRIRLSSNVDDQLGDIANTLIESKHNETKATLRRLLVGRHQRINTQLNGNFAALDETINHYIPADALATIGSHKEALNNQQDKLSLQAKKIQEDLQKALLDVNTDSLKKPTF